MSWLKTKLVIALSAPVLLGHQAWAGQSKAAPLPGLPGSAVPASRTPGTSLPAVRIPPAPATPALSAPRPAGSPMLSIPVAPAAFSHGLLQMQEELDTQHTVRGTVMNGKGHAEDAAPTAAPQPSSAMGAQTAPLTTPQNNSVDSFFQVPRTGVRSTPPANPAPQTETTTSAQLRGPLPTEQPQAAGTTTGSRWARWHLQSQAWKTSQTHSHSASTANATASTDVQEHKSDDDFHLGRALYHMFDNMGVPLPYNKDEALAPSLRAQPMELSVAAKKVPNNPTATQPTSRRSADENPSAAAKIPMSELEGVELPAPGDAPKTSP